MPNFTGCDLIVCCILDDVREALKNDSFKGLHVVIRERVHAAYMNGFSENLQINQSIRDTHNVK